MCLFYRQFSPGKAEYAETSLVVVRLTMTSSRPPLNFPSVSGEPRKLLQRSIEGDIFDRCVKFGGKPNGDVTSCPVRRDPAKPHPLVATSDVRMTSLRRVAKRSA